MGCDCGKPKCDGHCGVSPAVLQINNPSECVLFHRVEVPASMGDSKTNPPKSGAYKNVLLYYEADQTSWLYSSDGVPQKLVNGLTNYEDAINLPQINGVTLLGDKSSADLKLADAPMVITVANGNTSWSGADTAEDVYDFFLNKGKVNIIFNGDENYSYEIVSAAYIPWEEKMMCTLAVATMTGGETTEFDGNALFGTMTLYTADKAIDVSQIELQPKLYVADFTGLDLGYNELSGLPATTYSIGMVKPSDGLSVSSDGTLTVIDHVFDTVADMKASTNLVAGSYAQTLGFHALNDGGGATYYITDTGTANEMDVIAVGDLYANLVHTDSVYIRQLGAHGDGSTNDTSYFVRAFTIADNVIVNKTASSYKVQYIKVLENKKLEGECLPYVEIDIERDGSTVVPDMADNSAMDKIYLKSLDANLANNRLDIRATNVSITNCRIEGFQHSGYNAWGILLTGAKQVVIDNCYFTNNTQSDIALVEGCEDITINNCSGSSLHINFEPQYTPLVNNVVISECHIAKLDLRENQYLYHTNNNVSIRNCIIDLLEYDGANTTFIDCIIKDIQQQGGNGSSGWGGQVKFINSLNMGSNLISDIHLDSFEPSKTGTSEWRLNYSPVGVQVAISLAYVDNYPVITLNPDHTRRTVTIEHQPINVSDEKVYMLRLNAMADYTDGAHNISLNTVIECYDSSDNSLGTIEPSMFGGQSGTKTPIHEECYFFKPAEDTSYIILRFRNANYGEQSFSIRSCELFNINSSELSKNEVPSPSIRHKRIYSGTATYTNINNVAGDLMLYSAPTAGGNIGQVCTTGGYPATWKTFGSIAS